MGCGVMAEWVSVDSRVPESAIGNVSYWETPFLVVIDGGVTIGFWREGQTVEYWSSWNDERVTHWMPLPSPPATGSNDNE